jgi:hypothetical protein
MIKEGTIIEGPFWPENLLSEKFESVNIKIEISAKDGEMLKSEYEDKIKETINQKYIT